MDWLYVGAFRNDYTVTTSSTNFNPAKISKFAHMLVAQRPLPLSQNMILQLTYNFIPAMDNNHPSYEQTSQTYQIPSAQHHHKRTIGTLMSKYERRKQIDDEQDLLITRKKIVYPGNSLNYSQIYSDIRISRNQKLSTTAIDNPNKNTAEHPSKRTVNHPTQQPNPSLAYFPKSLPKITRNPKINSQLDAPRWDKNASESQIIDEQQANRQIRQKAFSISHYDIYKPKVEKAGSAAQHSEKSHKEEQSFIKNSSYASSSQQQEEQEEQLAVKFEESERNMPDPIQSQFQSSSSTHLLKKEFLAAQRPDAALKQINEEEIRVESKIGSIRKREVKESTKEGLVKIEEKVKEEVTVKTEENVESELPQISKGRKEQHNKVISQENSRIKDRRGGNDRADSFQPGRIKDRRGNEEHEQSYEALPTKDKNADITREMKKDEPNPNNDITQNDRQQSHEPPLRKDRAVKNKVIQSDNYLLKRQNPPQAETTNIEDQQSKAIIPHRSSVQIQSNDHPPHHQNTALKRLSPLPSHEQRSTSKERPSLQQPNYKVKEVQNPTEYQIRNDSFHNFNVQEYTKVHDVLKAIQSALKTPQIDAHSLIKQLKHYLEIIAGGGLDHMDGYDMPLHRLKIIKNALLYERIAVVIIGLAYAVKKMRQTLKYLINLIIYTTNSNLIILKILQNCQITPNNNNKNPLYSKADRLVLKRHFDTVRNNSDIILDAIFKISKYEDAFHESFKDIFKSIGKNSLEQTFYNVLEFFAFFLCVSDLHMTIPFLAVAPNPYLRETVDKRPTLLIDVIEIFCHGTRKSKSHVFRPYTEHFLNEMAQYYELVSFTSAYPNQIDRVIDILDTKKHIKHRLYRHHTLMKNGSCYKDTERIGRDLRGVILIDSQINFLAGEVNNTVLIPNWRGSKSDTTLAELCPILAAISIKHLDCRQATRKIYEQQLKNESAGIKYLNFGLNLQ